MLDKVLKRKLISNEGASLMVALLFFVMCATIGSVILAAATASSGRLANLTRKDQTYFATKSAADFLGESICPSGSDEKKIVLKIEYVEDDPSSKTVKILKNGTFVDFNSSNQKILAQDILYMTLNSNFNMFDVEKMNPVYMSSTNSIINTNPEKTTKVKYYQTLKLNFTVSGTDNEVLNVNGNVYMNHDLDLFVILKPSSEDDKDQNIVNLWFYSVKKLEESQSVSVDGKVKHSNTYTISWEKPVVSKGDVPVEKEVTGG